MRELPAQESQQFAARFVTGRLTAEIANPGAAGRTLGKAMLLVGAVTALSGCAQVGTVILANDVLTAIERHSEPELSPALAELAARPREPITTLTLDMDDMRGDPPARSGGQAGAPRAAPSKPVQKPVL